jgi:hypothetical protein
MQLYGQPVKKDVMAITKRLNDCKQAAYRATPLFREIIHDRLLPVLRQQP